MQTEKAKAMANTVVDSLIELMENAVSDFLIQGVDEDKNHLCFVIEFKAYEYFLCGISYEKGRVLPYICFGESIIVIQNLAGWWEELKLQEWINELAIELKLRIPDKYLEAKGWQ